MPPEDDFDEFGLAGSVPSEECNMLSSPEHKVDRRSELPFPDHRETGLDAHYRFRGFVHLLMYLYL